MTYPEAIQFLYGLRTFGLKLGLENTFKLAALAGNPQEHLRFIHIAGTNGKGSTCAMLEGIYRAAGLRVGLFTSPHLVSFRERIQVNRRLIPEVDVVRLVAEMRTLLKAFPADHHPTFFEVLAVMALRYFAEQRCDLVVWETGLGGRLDATNIVTPLASVITNVQFDHQKWLGNTRSEIAAEKAGIIKPGAPLLTAADEPEALATIRATAKSLGASITVIAAPGSPPDTARRASGDDILGSIMLPLPGAHQRLNAALAIATVRTLHDRIPVTDDAIRRGLETVSWAGRMQIVNRSSGQTLVLDGAHNPEAVTALVSALSKHFPERAPALILGILADKDWQRMCEVLAPAARRIAAVPVSSNRTVDAESLRRVCASANPAAEVVACPSLATALSLLAAEPFVLVAGSLYLVGEALERLGERTDAATNERDLNEWAIKP